MAKKDMGLSLYDIEKKKVVFRVTYDVLKNDVCLKSNLRDKILSGKFKLYCNCNPKARIEKKIDIALRVYDAKKDTYEKHKYNCAGKPVNGIYVEGCGRTDDNTLLMDYKENAKAIPSIMTIIKNINYEVWNFSTNYHFRKSTREKIAETLSNLKIKKKYAEIYQNVLLFHRKIFLTLQENQIVINGKDLSAMLYNAKNHKFKNLKEGEKQYFQMIINNILVNDDGTASVFCINNFAKFEKFEIKNPLLLKKIMKEYKPDSVFCMAGFVKNENGEKVIDNCEVYIPSKRGLIATSDNERQLIDTATDDNLNFKCVMNYEFPEFYHPMFIFETNDENGDILYDLIEDGQSFEEIDKKTKLAESKGLIYRYWKTDYTSKPYIPKELRKKKRQSK